jgi:hypothetical protein
VVYDGGVHLLEENINLIKQNGNILDASKEIDVEYNKEETEYLLPYVHGSSPECGTKS